MSFILNQTRNEPQAENVPNQLAWEGLLGGTPGFRLICPGGSTLKAQRGASLAPALFASCSVTNASGHKLLLHELTEVTKMFPRTLRNNSFPYALFKVPHSLFGDLCFESASDAACRLDKECWSPQRTTTLARNWPNLRIKLFLLMLLFLLLLCALFPFERPLRDLKIGTFSLPPLVHVVLPG